MWLAFALVAACSDREEASQPYAPPPATLPGQWSGVYPCANCPGIDVRLWLRADGRFFIEQSYQPGEATAALSAHGLGRWAWQAEERLLVLSGDGPERRFERLADEILRLQTASPVPHRLTRHDGEPARPPALRIVGEVRRQGDRYVLHECLTDYRVPLSGDAETRRLARQYRSVVPEGETARAELVGRFRWQAGAADDAPPSAFAVERFVTLRPGEGCRP